METIQIQTVRKLLEMLTCKNPQPLFGLLIQDESHALQLVIASLFQILQEIPRALII